MPIQYFSKVRLMLVNKSPGNWKLVTICHEKGGSFSNVEAAEPQWSPLANTVRIWPPLSLLTVPVEGPKSWGHKEIGAAFWRKSQFIEARKYEDHGPAYTASMAKTVLSTVFA